MMDLQNFAKIGKAPFIMATGVQKSYKKTTYEKIQELDRAATGCFSCPYYNDIDFLEYLPEACQKEALARCVQCSHRVYKDVYREITKYINEKNMYGNKPRLKSVAMKLLLLYHFLSPDENGIIRSINPKSVAKYLQCHVRTIKNANAVLQKYDYIMYCNDGLLSHSITVRIIGYDSYALPADKGGRGYATFSKDFLEELVKIKDINQLRILIRAALEADTKRNTQDIIIKENYSTLQGFLPGYCKPGIIKRALSNFTDILGEIQYHDDDGYILMRMNPAYHGRQNYEQQNLQNTALVKKYVDNIDQVMEQINLAVSGKLPISQEACQQLQDMGFRSTIGGKFYKPFGFTADDYRDLGLLVTTYSFKQVKKALTYVHEKYITSLTPVKIGALIRTILTKDASFSLNAV